MKTPPKNFIYSLDETFKPTEGAAFVPADTSYPDIAEAFIEISESTLLQKMKPWADHLHEILIKDQIDDKGVYTSNVYHSTNDTAEKPKLINSILPIFEETPNSVDNMLHFIKVIKNTTQFLNPGQHAIIGVDQPLYALGKKLQFTGSYPEIDLSKVFLLMGPMHIEQVRTIQSELALSDTTH